MSCSSMLDTKAPPPAPAPRVVSLGGVSLSSPVSAHPTPSVSTIISRTKQVVTSSSPVLLQPAHR